jgi:protein-L-isoaspartate(D-aspartate) O-methyltransferase
MTAMSSVPDASGRAGEHLFGRERARMVREQITARGVKDLRVLAAMERVPRHRFVPGRLVGEAHGDYPVAIGQGQTVSQPYIVAYMIEALELAPRARVLEVGTGAGYQAAVLAETGFDVWTIEIRPGLAEEAETTLQALGYGSPRVHVRCGDGALGWPEAAPFDGIIGAAAARGVPPALLEQLAPGGTLVLPVGDDEQVLWRYRRTPGGFRGEQLFAVRFVPMIGGGASV